MRQKVKVHVLTSVRDCSRLWGETERHGLGSLRLTEPTLFKNRRLVCGGLPGHATPRPAGGCSHHRNRVAPTPHCLPRGRTCVNRLCLLCQNTSSLGRGSPYLRAESISQSSSVHAPALLNKPPHVTKTQTRLRKEAHCKRLPEGN